MNNFYLPRVMAISCLTSLLISFFHVAIAKTSSSEKASTTKVSPATAYGCFDFRVFSSGCIKLRNSKRPASAWRMSVALSADTATFCEPKGTLKKKAAFFFTLRA